MRIGVAGVGRIGAMHAANLAAVPAVRELAVFDPDAARAAEVASQIGARVAPTLDALLASVDGVVISTPTPTHPDAVRAAIAAGVPALCEKPIASDLDEMRQLVEDVEASGVPVLVGFQRRFDPTVVELKRRIDAGELGRLYLVTARGQDASLPDLSYVAHSGGIFRDLLIHDLDAVPWLVGKPVASVYATGSVLVHQAFADANDVDNTAVTLTFTDGTLAVLTGGRHDPLGYDHRLEVLGSKDSLAVGLDTRTPLTSLESDGPRSRPEAYPGFPERFARAYAAEMETFAALVGGWLTRAETGVLPHNPSPVRDSLTSLEIALACDTSRREGRVVELAPVDAPEPSSSAEPRTTQPKIAGAPISWGVCEVPGWGAMLPADRVLTEMHELGLSATEIGPPGYLPTDPAELAELLGGHDLTLVGGFLAVPLHDQARAEETHAEALRTAELIRAGGGDVLVLAAATGVDGYDSRPELDDASWAHLLKTLDTIASDVRERYAVRTVLHPHVGTLVERPEEIERVLSGSGVELCIDTGHVLVGGGDPLALARAHADRVGHVHLKDVDAVLAERVRGGELSYTEGVQAGLYRPLGEGDVPIEEIVRALAAGYDGWWVLEQDVALPSVDSASGEKNPVHDVRRSVEFLRAVLDTN